VKQYNEFLNEDLLTEKLININQGKKYGQVVFLAGGAGSGKGFASKNFLNIADFKVRDVDAWKLTFLKLANLTSKHPELKGLSLKDPKNVAFVHEYVRKFKIKDKTLDLMLQNMRNPNTLPNIMFDVTLKDMSDISKVLPSLITAGYKAENIHVVWVLTDYSIAVKQNRERERVVPDDILLDTHIGAANTMWDILGGKAPKAVNGGIYVILNNQKHTILFKETDGKDYRHAKDKSDNNIRKNVEAQGFDLLNKLKVRPKREKPGKDRVIIKDFKYLTFKYPKKPPLSDAKIKLQLFTWVTNNVPFTDKVKAFKE